LIMLSQPDQNKVATAARGTSIPTCQQSPAATSQIPSLGRPGSPRLATKKTATTGRTSLEIPNGITIEEWRNLGQQIFVICDSSSWWLGDWLIYGEAQYPNRYKQAISETSLDYQTLRNYAWVARRFPPEQRRSKVSFQHHAEVASLPPEERGSWLAAAEESGWSRNELRRRLRANREQKLEREIDDKQTQLRVNLANSRKKRWEEAAENAETDLLTWIVSVLDEAAQSQVHADA
jgi:hypothetical protein